MAISFPSDNQTLSQGSLTSSGYIDMPSSDSVDMLLLFVSYVQPSAASTTLNTPSGATLIASNTGVKIFSLPGGTTAAANITFATNPCSFQAICIRVVGQRTTSAFTGASTGTTSGTSHLLNSAINSPYDSAVFIGGIVMPTIPTNGVLFQSADDIHEVIANRYRNFPGDPDTYQAGLSIAVRWATAAAQAGAHTWSSLGGFFPSSISVSSASSCGFWISPLLAPSAPVVTAPVTGGKFTVGSTQTISWNPATDPAVAAASLIYKVYITANDGITYTLINTTSAGVLSYAWNTTGYAPGTYKVKLVANNGTDDGLPGYGGNFQLFADTVPSPPVGLSPVGYISQAARTFTWTAVNPDYDSQSAYELEWSSGSDMSSSSTTGTVVSTTSSKSFSASTDILTPVGTKYWRVKTKGVVDATFGAWSEVATVIVAAAPATPSITSAATATTAQWTVTFSGVAHSKFRHRWVLSGTEYSNNIVLSSAFSFVSPFNLATTAVWNVYVSVFDPTTGLESLEGTQALTVTYTGPATPTIVTTAHVELGAIQVAVTNSDTVDHTRITVQEVFGADVVEFISPRLGNDATFLYFATRADNGGTGANELIYRFKARSYTTAQGYTDSSGSELSLTLEKLHIHVVDKTSVASDGRLHVSLPIVGDITKKYIKSHKSASYQGRTEFVTHAGQSKYAELTYDCHVVDGDTLTYPALKAVFDANATLCIRDPRGNKIFGRMKDLPKVSLHGLTRFSLTFIETEHTEYHAR